MTEFPVAPAHVDPFVVVLGVDLAIEFLLCFGGAELYLTANPKGRSALVELVGMEKAAALATAAEFLPKRIPLAKPWIAAVLKSKGLPVAQIARKLHASDVAVRGWLKRASEPGGGGDPATDTRQLPLF